MVIVVCFLKNQKLEIKPLYQDLSERQCAEFVLNLIADARDNWFILIYFYFENYFYFTHIGEQMCLIRTSGS